MLNDKILRQDTTAGDSRSGTVACVFKVGLDKNLDARCGGSPTGGFVTATKEVRTESQNWPSVTRL
jgi:hypothetical protein